MSLSRGIDGPEPLRDEPLPPLHEERRNVETGLLGYGTLACPSCDAPVALGGERVSPPDPLNCPFCTHHAPARDFLSLKAPTRPARVAVRVTMARAARSAA